MPIVCDHPRPKLDLPGYIPRRMAWQVPANIPGLPPDAARVIRQALQGVYDELSRQGQTRNVIPLVEDLFVRPGSVVVGVGDGQTITLLPPGATGYTDPVTVILTDVEEPVNVVRPDGTVDIITEPGAYDYEPAGEGDYETLPGSATRPFPGAPIYDIMAPPFNAIGHLAGDDTAALNAVIDAANALPGMIYLGPAHRYTGALHPITGNNIVMRGRGRFNGGTILQDDGGNGGPTIQNCQYSGVEHVWITGSRVQTANWGIRIVDCFRARISHILISQMAFGVETLRSVLTEHNHVQLSDTYGVYGFLARGDITNYCHAAIYKDCGGGTGFPLTATGTPAAWVTGTSYAVGNIVFANSGLYQCSKAGISGASAPSGIPSTDVNLAHSTAIVDGSAEWYFAMPACSWFLHASYCHTFMLDNCGGLQGAIGLHVADTDPGVGSTPLFTRTDDFSIDHPFTAGIRLEAGAHARFNRTFVTSVLEGRGIEIFSGHGGDWEFNGGEIFGAQKQGFYTEKGNGSFRGYDIGAVSYGFDNVYDAIALVAGTSKITVTDCSTDFLTPLVQRYGVSIGAGCANIVVTDNRLSGLSGPLLRAPDQSTTVLVRDNLPRWAENVASDSYERVTLAAGGTYTLSLLATTNTVFVTVSGTGTAVVDLITHAAGNPGIQLTIVKATSNATLVLRDGNAGTSSIWLPVSVDWPLYRTSESVRLEHAFGRWRPISPPRLAVRFNSTGSEFIRRRLNFIPGTGITLTPSDDPTNEELDITITGGVVADGDKGDITVSSSGATWTIDGDVVTFAKMADIGYGVIGNPTFGTTANPSLIVPPGTGATLYDNGAGSLVFAALITACYANASVTLAKLANLAQSTIIGRAEGAGTGVPTALTPTQVVAIIDGESPTWTASHRFDSYIQFGTSTALPSTGDIRKAGTLLIQTADDLNLTALDNCTVDISNTLTLDGGAGVAIVSANTIGLTATTSITAQSANVTVGASADISLQANNTIIDEGSFCLDDVLGSTTTTENNFSVAGANVARFDGTTSLTGMVASHAGQLAVIANVHTSLILAIQNDHSGSSAANRFLLDTTSRWVRPNCIALAWYDGTSSRWRLITGDRTVTL